MHPTIHCLHPVRDKNQEFECILLQIAHFTVTGENEAGVDLVLIQPFLLYHGNHVVLRLNSIFKQNFYKKEKGFVPKPGCIAVASMYYPEGTFGCLPNKFLMDRIDYHSSVI